MKNLSLLLSPKTVCVVGASRKENSVGFAVLRNMVFSGFKGIIYPVNPFADSILGLKVYKTVKDLPEIPELAVILVKAEIVPEVLLECAEKGIKFAIIISAGFKEAGKEGERLEERVKQISKEKGIRVLGPNCIGVMNTDPSVSFTTNFGSDMPLTGEIGLISQSGAICVAILDFARTRGIGFSKVISMGNKVDIDEVELLEYLGNDEKTRIILMYIEELRDGKRFIEVAKKVSKNKPILALKAGMSPEGARAVSSHTGSLAGSPEVYKAVFKQAGVIAVETPGELFEYASLLASQPYPKGNRVGIVTNAGGPGIVATDACIEYGLKVEEISQRTKNKIKPFVSPNASLKNPVDLLAEADAEKFEAAVKALYEDKNIDAIYFLMAPQRMIDIEAVARVIVKYAGKRRKPLIPVLMGILDVEKGAEILRKNGVPFYRFPDAAARALSVAYKYRKMTEKKTERHRHFRFSKKIKEIFKNKKGFIDLDECFKVLELAGFPLVEWDVCKDEKELIKKSESMGFPLVLKIASGEVVHKMDQGGVILNIRNKDELRNAYKKMINRFKGKVRNYRKVVIQKMVDEKTKEVILGSKKDERFGNLIVFGLGGIFVEIFKDVSFRLAPVSVEEAEEMVSEIKFYSFLKGVRGEKPSDIKALQKNLLRLSSFVLFADEIKEMDINPLFVFEKGKGVKLVDARIKV